jgi:hypothetical protein
MKWVHTASLGLGLLVLGALVIVVRLMGSEGDWTVLLARILVWVGAIAVVVGVLGVVLGGRHGGSSSQA